MKPTVYRLTSLTVMLSMLLIPLVIGVSATPTPGNVALNVLESQGRDAPQLRYELARLLHALGETTAAREELELLLRTTPPNSDIAQLALQVLGRLQEIDQEE